MNATRVLLVDDHAIVRQGLRALLATAADIEVIGEAENGQQAVREAERLCPDVVLMDLAMPLLNGIEAARQIAHEVPATRVLVLSTYSDAQHLRQAVEVGVAGYVMKESASDYLVDAIRETRHGGASFSPPLFNCLLQAWRSGLPDSRGAKPKPATLSCREAQVLQLVAEGYANKQIAALLSLSRKTVEKHRQTLMRKLKLHSIAALTRYAVANGIMDLNTIPRQTPNLADVHLDK